MAFLEWSDTAFDMRHIGLNTLFAGVTLQDAAATPITGGAFDVTVGSTVFHIPDHTMAADTEVFAAGASSLAILGTGLVHDAQGNFSAGTISGLVAPNFELNYVSIKATALTAAVATASQADDAALFQKVLSGNDNIISSAGNDVIFAGAGKDLIEDMGGSDRFFGGAGDDFIQSGDGNDVVFGGSGNDLLWKFSGHSVMSGGTGDDTLVGGWDRDVMTGGAGNDRFVFMPDQGHDVVTDFTHGADKLVLTGATAMSDLKIVQHGTDTMISEGHWSVLLKGVDHTTLDASDFILNQPDFLNAGEIAFFTGWDYAA